MITYLLTCHTEGCINSNISIPLSVDPSVINFMCGACGNDITDAVPQE